VVALMPWPPIQDDAKWLEAQTLHPAMVEALGDLQQGRAQGVNYGILGLVRVFESWRSPARQDVLFMQGRQPLADVNGARAKLGLSPIPASENKVVTNRKGVESNHSWGVAVDLVRVDSKTPWAGVDWWLTTGVPQWWESLGHVWGGRWSTLPDPSHFELSVSVPIESAVGGVVPEEWWAGLPAVPSSGWDTATDPTDDKSVVPASAGGSVVGLVFVGLGLLVLVVLLSSREKP
jgi:hypothetical protein